MLRHRKRLQLLWMKYDETDPIIGMKVICISKNPNQNPSLG